MKLERGIERLEAEFAKRKRVSNNDARVREATSDPYVWATQYTKTYNEHWQEEGRPSPYEPFPGPDVYPHLPYVFAAIDAQRINLFEKSRDMMLSWACVAYLTLNAMKVLQRGVIFQTQKTDKAKQLVGYAKCLYEQQPAWLREAFPLTKPLSLQPKLELHFAHGGSVIGIPGGGDQIRSYHPWGYLLDEASFVVEAGECYNQALAVVKGKIILNSSAGPGWYADFRNDIVRNAED